MGVELARGDVGQKKLADLETCVDVVVAELLDQVRSAVGCSGGLVPVGREPRVPDRAVSHYLAQVEAVAVEADVDLVFLAALILEAAGELGVAHLALCIGKLEPPVTDGGEGRKREVSD